MTDLENMGIDWERLTRESARLVILKALAEQSHGRLDSSMLEEILPLFAVRKPRTWIHEQLEHLAAHGAISVIRAGTVMTATLQKTGRRHLDRDEFVSGVKRPSEPGI